MLTHTLKRIHVANCSGVGHCFQHTVVCFPVLSHRVWLDLCVLGAGLVQSKSAVAHVFNDLILRGREQQHLPETGWVTGNHTRRSF